MNSLGSVIARYRKLKGLNQHEVCELMEKEGYPILNTALSNWEKERAVPSTETFLVLCRVLEIKDIYEAVFGTNPFNKTSKLSDEGRDKVDTYIDDLLFSGRYNRPEPVVIPFKAGIIRLYTLPVSAGTGNFLDSDDYIEVDRDNTIPKKADFGVKISGDSMEPRFTNGQTVWIEQTSSLEDGEIGIFLLDGNAYCKKLQNNKKGIFLVSLNEKYNPIPIKEYDSLKIFGRVVL